MYNDESNLDCYRETSEGPERLLVFDGKGEKIRWEVKRTRTVEDLDENGNLKLNENGSVKYKDEEYYVYPEGVVSKSWGGGVYGWSLEREWTDTYRAVKKGKKNVL
ncbi:Protein of unknown function [Pyronema omphalodes CBS 100304]|uniref:Uncharacterized protein n=1 Tax=Pyronema omphalodes (strain CBS 100304) TaxID=1076935 RepID=U4LXG0_PYROM|nr:Protein of unknown function [Pyronema omphalodes CBS 100304]